MRNTIENTFTIIGSILIGIPVGFFVGIFCWLKFPFVVYAEARKNLAIQRIARYKAKIEEMKSQNGQGDIWQRHIERMEAKKNNYDN